MVNTNVTFINQVKSSASLMWNKITECQKTKKTNSQTLLVIHEKYRGHVICGICYVDMSTYYSFSLLLLSADFGRNICILTSKHYAGTQLQNGYIS